MANCRTWQIRKFRKSWAGECLEFLGFFFIQTYKPRNKMIEKGENLSFKQVQLQGSRAQSSTKVKGEWILQSATKIHKPVTLCALCHFPPSILCSCVYFVLCPYWILDYTVIYRSITGSRPVEQQEWPWAGIHGYMGVVRSTGPWEVLLSNSKRQIWSQQRFCLLRNFIHSPTWQINFKNLKRSDLIDG